MDLPAQVKIVEVGPRDGLQNESRSLTSEQRVEFINMLEACGLRCIEAGSFVRPDRVPQMAGTEKVISQLDLQGEIHYPVLVPNIKGLEGALACGVREIAVFAAASETFSQKNINCSIEESIQRFTSVVETALQQGIRVRGYISCVMGCPYEGDVSSELVIETANKLIDLGCYEISLGDTIGTGTPLQTFELMEEIQKRIPRQQLAVHFHDTFGQALANIMAALQSGISVIDAAVAGLGGCPYARGASGNVATEDVVYMLNGLGISHGVDLGKLISTGRIICDLLQRPVMSRVNLATQP
jgi:hydroxymethylglutaryl-CoA lyase